MPLPAVVVTDFSGVRRIGERVAGQLSGPASGTRSGRHAAPKQPGVPKVFDGSRFLLFSAIGGFVFLLGFGLQAWLTGGLHVPPFVSYLAQAVLSIETSFALNRWLTWRDRDTPLLRAFARFNAQKTVTVALNLVLYAGLLRLHVNYLVANVVLTAFFTVVNFVAGDRFVFVPAGSRLHRGSAAGAGIAGPQAPPLPAADRRLAWREREIPLVSVVIPCRSNESTIGAAVQSLLDQDYPGLAQIILVGSPDDTTWAGLAGISDRRLLTLELPTPPGMRDANYKRNSGITGASGDLIALVDSDIVLPSDWLRRAVAALAGSGADCVAGGMRSIHDTYWGRYTDGTRLGAKTPRIDSSYEVTARTFGARGRKPPITANTLFTPELYAACPIDASWSHGSYEDYEWFWRVVSAGYRVEVCEELFGWHHHRRGIRPLIKEYLRSSRGCAYFVRAHPESPFARRRLLQAIGLPLAAVTALAGAVAVAVAGYGQWLGVAAAAAIAGLAADQLVRSRKLESLTYPLTGLLLGTVFTSGLVTHLIRSGSASRQAAAGRRRRPSIRPRLLSPLTAICLVQAALSLTLVRANTAFTDEAAYLWIGRLVVRHWTAGGAWPAPYGQQVLPGSPILYPPLAWLANEAGGLAGARVLSLVFMLGATVLLYLVTAELLGRPAATAAVALWALTEPVLRLAFVSPEPLSIFVIALCAWLIVRAGRSRRRHGELVALAALALALANAITYYSAFIDPVVFGFAFFAWADRRGGRPAAYAAGWMAGAWAMFLTFVLTESRSWSGFAAALSDHDASSHQALAQVLSDVWEFAGLLLALALIGVAVARSAPGRWRPGLLTLLGLAALVVPAEQLASRTSDLIDLHLAFGTWFAAMAAGYACAVLLRRLASARRQLAAVACTLALCYPSVVSWQSASEQYQSWADATPFVTAFRPLAASSTGQIFVAGQEHIAQYYTAQGLDWRRWNSGGLPLDPAAPTVAFYTSELRAGDYGLVALFYSASYASQELPKSFFSSPRATTLSARLLTQQGLSANEPGLPALTRALRRDKAYRLMATGQYDSAHQRGIYVIWRRVKAS